VFSAPFSLTALCCTGMLATYPFRAAFLASADDGALVEARAAFPQLTWLTRGFSAPPFTAWSTNLTRVEDLLLKRIVDPLAGVRPLACPHSPLSFLFSVRAAMAASAQTCGDARSWACAVDLFVTVPRGHALTCPLLLSGADGRAHASEWREFMLDIELLAEVCVHAHWSLPAAAARCRTQPHAAARCRTLRWC
jgi:hypothetical protein